MKSNAEIRREARRILKGPWLWRLMSVMCLLQIVMQVVCSMVSRMMNHLQVQSWTDFYLSKFSMLGNGIPFCVPSQRCAWQMTGVSLFELFISYIFGAIVAFGYARVVLKAADNRESRWFADSLEGFRRPLESAWLMLQMNVRILLWCCVCFIPGIIAVYRYRQAWYLKSDAPDCSARDCIAASSRMMKGFKAQAFRLDVSFVGYLAMAAILAGGATALHTAGGVLFAAVSCVAGLAACVLLFYTLVYYFVARAVFYRAMKEEKKEVPSCQVVA